MLPFNRPYLTGREFGYMAEAHAGGMLAGDGPFTRRCHARLEALLGVPKALLTHSGTAALELAAILADIGPGDEVILPSYTFASTANAFVLRGAVPVFVDIRADTLNIDETRIEAAITPRTRAIVPVHYAGVACEMDTIMAIAEAHRLTVVEDAAQGMLARYKGRALGSIGHFGCLSFHETKNISCGEGGALLVNDPERIERAEIVREKGTDRARFFRGEVDRYTWCEMGSSYLPGELSAAFLCAQLEAAEDITARRLSSWQHYHEALAEAESRRRLRRPVVPAACAHNAHMYYVLLASLAQRTALIAAMRERGVGPVFHYVPLHSSPAGRRHGRCHGPMTHTDALSARLLRLPLWIGVDEPRVVDTLLESLAALEASA